MSTTGPPAPRSHDYGNPYRAGANRRKSASLSCNNKVGVSSRFICDGIAPEYSFFQLK
jgi:hypothetical protein